MPYIHFTEEQKLRAGSVDLVEFRGVSPDPGPQRLCPGQ